MSTAPSRTEAAARIEAAEAVFSENKTVCLAASDGSQPWAGTMFFIEDEPQSGRLDICCALHGSSRLLAMVRENPSIAFVVGGEDADRWLQGVGRAELLSDDADASAVLKRLKDRAPQAARFIDGGAATAVRIHVHRLMLTDLAADPPVAEFSFA